MTITIFGASGRTGQLLVKTALEQGHNIRAFVRRKNALDIKHPNIQILTGQLSDSELIEKDIENADACISVLGGSSLRKNETEFVHGIETIVNSMEKHSVKRMIYLSSAGAGDSRYYMSRLMRFLILDIFLRIPIEDHNQNERRIMSSKLDWTILRPGGLTDGPPIDKLRYGSEKMSMRGNPKISRASIAKFMLAHLQDKKVFEKALWIME